MPSNSESAAYLRRFACLVRGHRRQWVHWISAPQPRGVNCEGDHWYIGRVCARCRKWVAFDAGLDFIHAHGYEPIIKAAARLAR